MTTLGPSAAHPGPGAPGLAQLPAARAADPGRGRSPHDDLYRAPRQRRARRARVRIL
ncbi:hypothetical protein [Parafrankia elaeagni]|uniref:hypothetical protein n=1 Tax=Parafrankia elaeagni TaxID=222534 RepID=UPI0003A9D2F3|nr:hypothetical protein [Parafrankia elaeagni]